MSLVASLALRRRFYNFNSNDKLACEVEPIKNKFPIVLFLDMHAGVSFFAGAAAAALVQLNTIRFWLWPRGQFVICRGEEVSIGLC